MINDDFKQLFIRDLDRLKGECEAYSDESKLWIKVDGINNSAGNLTMHLCGNLQHFIGAVLGESDYKRNRDFEFSGKASFEELLSEIESTKQVIDNYFNNVDPASFSSKYPLELFGYPMTVNYFLIHLEGHLNYHLGQINYHRRILS
ncbi:DinB family protein [Ekhidna sp.]|uniref:DinB family protein n=1 Tax=Ekhidna sp. TaxID=2608089 RepID=UPI003B5BE28D